MKVRWMENSLRLRITPGELAELQAGQTITERALFPGGWSVALQPGAESVLHSDTPGTLTLTLSSGELAELAQPQTEGVYVTAERYKFFVEKDFPCAHPRPKEAQESTATFAPPSGFAERHKTLCS